MPGISVSKICVPFGGGGIDWSSYWATRTPSALVLTALSPTSIKVDWTNAGAEDYDGHSAERSEDGVTYAEIDTIPIGTNTFTDTELDDSTLYYYRIRAYKISNGITMYSDYSSIETEETIYYPDKIATLNMWNDISQETDYENNDPITSVHDFSGNDYHITSSSAGRRPLYITNVLNGQPSARFDGVDDYIRNTAVSIPATKTMFLVFNKISSASNVLVYHYYSGLILGLKDDKIRVSTDGPLDADSPEIANGTPYIVSVVVNGADSRISINGGNTKTGTIAAHTSTQILLACAAGISGFQNMDFFEHLIYEGALTSANIRKVEEYLSWKYDIELEPI